MPDGLKDGGYSLTEATQTGDELLMLRTLRYCIAQKIEAMGTAEDERGMAALSKQFMDYTKEIRALEKSQPKPDRRTALDDARNKRKKAPIKRKPGTAN